MISLQRTLATHNRNSLAKDDDRDRLAAPQEKALQAGQSASPADFF
jgi:hypothetical protein